MATVTIHDAKTNLSKLIARAEAGEEIVIARGKDPVVRTDAPRRPTAANPEAGTTEGKNLAAAR